MFPFDDVIMNIVVSWQIDHLSKLNKLAQKAFAIAQLSMLISVALNLPKKFPLNRIFADEDNLLILWNIPFIKN